MARLPSGRYLIQQIGEEIIFFEDGSERELARWHANRGNEMMNAQRVISELEELSPMDRAMAHLWSGYFWAFTAYPGDGRTIPEWAKTGWSAEEHGQIPRLTGQSETGLVPDEEAAATLDHLGYEEKEE